MSSTPFIFLVVYGVLLNSSLHCVVQVGQQVGQLDDSERKVVAKRVEDLAKELDSNRTSDRDRAEKQLIELGEICLEFLPPISDDQSPELVMRLERIRSSLDTQESQDAFRASTVSLNGTMSGRDALEKISKLTANRFELGDSERLQKTITADFEDTPFWEAADEILDQLGLSLAGYDGAEFELLETTPQSTLRISSATYCGPFRLEPIRMVKSSDLVSPWRSSLTITMLISWEPRLNPSLIKLDPSTLKFVCDNGEQLELLDSTPLLVSPSGGSQAALDLEFRMPSQPVRSVLNWSCELEAVLPSPMATISFSDLSVAEGKSLVSGMLSVTVDSIRKNRSVREIALAVSIKSQNNDESDWESIATQQETVLFDSRGSKVENVGWSSESMSENQRVFTYLFDFPGEPEGYRLNFRAPASIKRGSLPFDGGEIPIP